MFELEAKRYPPKMVSFDLQLEYVEEFRKLLKALKFYLGKYFNFAFEWHL